MLAPTLLLTLLAAAPDGGSVVGRPDGGVPTPHVVDAGVVGSARDGGASAAVALAPDGGPLIDRTDAGVVDGGDGGVGLDPSNAFDGGMPLSQPSWSDAGPIADGLAFIEQAFAPGAGIREANPMTDATADGGVSDDADDASPPHARSTSFPVSATLIIVLIFAFFISRVLQRVLGDRILSSGVEYIFVGFLMGPHVFGFLSVDALSTLMPVVSLLLGFAGLLLGLRLRGQRAHGRAFVIGALIALFTAAVVATVFYFVLPFIVSEGPRDRVFLALTIGAASAAVSAPAIVGGAEFFRARGRLKDLLESAAHAGNVVAVFIAGIALILDRASQDAMGFGPDAARWVGTSLALGVGSGILFRIFVGRVREGTTLFLATTALVTFASGMAAGLGVSPLLLNLVAGLVVSLILNDTQSLIEKLRTLERPALTTFAIFAGAMWHLDALPLLALPVCYALLRRVTLPLSSFVAAFTIPRAPRVPRFSDGLLVQGGFAVAVAVNFAQVHPEEGSAILTAVLVALLAQDILGIGAMRRLFGDQGELGTADVLSATSPTPVEESDATTSDDQEVTP
jgi:hypothetical protein